jgi:23S rRNA pseudouridine1911/1915/1917 synthase
MRLEVLHEDRDVVVVDKPPGLTAHPAAGQPDGTLANALLAHYPEMEGVGGPRRAGIVHRLDKGTSGLMVVARNAGSHALLTQQFKERRVTKRYLALVEGEVAPARGVIEVPLGRHPRHRQRMAPVRHGRPAATPYRVVERYGDHTLVEASPLTGRTHQIRVHFAALGHPLSGDATYGRRRPGLTRQFLHASFLAFRHPGTGEGVEFRSELPADLRRFLSQLGPGERS